MHAVDSAATGRRGDDGKQTGGVDAKARFFAFHIAAGLQAAGRLVHALRCQQRITGLLGGRDGDHGNDKHQRHGRQHRPALALITHLGSKRKAQRSRNQKDCQHLEEVG